MGNLTITGVIYTEYGAPNAFKTRVRDDAYMQLRCLKSPLGSFEKRAKWFNDGIERGVPCALLVLWTSAIIYHLRVDQIVYESRAAVCAC